MKNTRAKNQLNFALGTNIGSEYTISLFNALSPQTETYNPTAGINTQAGFISDMAPALSTQGLIKIQASGNTNGCVSWDTLINGYSVMIGKDNAGASEWSVSIDNNTFGYRAFLEFLKGNSIRVGKVKMSSANAAQLKKDWVIKRRYSDGTEFEERLSMGNMIAPEQVQGDMVVFNLDRIIDKYTSIEIELTPLQTLFSIVMDYQNF